MFWGYNTQESTKIPQKYIESLLPPYEYAWKLYAGSDFHTPGAQKQAKLLVVNDFVKIFENRKM